MGRRSSTETLARIVIAFLDQGTWKQADLARRCDVSTKALRARLDELTLAGMPIEYELDHPHAYWSVPPTWFPGGAVLKAADASLIARLLARLPTSQERQRAMRSVLAGAAASTLGNESEEGSRAGILSALEDAARARHAVEVRYTSPQRGYVEPRDLSVQRIVYGARLRFIGHCHRSERLKWYRVDRVETVAPRPERPFHAADPGDVDAIIAESFAGYRSDTAVDCAFFVRLPESRWVIHNLPEPMAVAHHENGVRITTRTAGLDLLARYVVGLGEAARAETPELRARVISLAQASLAAHTPIRKLTTRSVAPNGPSIQRSRAR
jgi:predicted DNA-binding transcriptional regulator YafY